MMMEFSGARQGSWWGPMHYTATMVDQDHKGGRGRTRGTCCWGPPITGEIERGREKRVSKQGTMVLVVVVLLNAGKGLVIGGSMNG